MYCDAASRGTMGTCFAGMAVADEQVRGGLRGGLNCSAFFSKALRLPWRLRHDDSRGEFRVLGYRTAKRGPIRFVFKQAAVNPA